MPEIKRIADQSEKNRHFVAENIFIDDSLRTGKNNHARSDNRQKCGESRKSVSFVDYAETDDQCGKSCNGKDMH